MFLERLASSPLLPSSMPSVETKAKAASTGGPVQLSVVYAVSFSMTLSGWKLFLHVETVSWLFSDLISLITCHSSDRKYEEPRSEISVKSLKQESTHDLLTFTVM